MDEIVMEEISTLLELLPAGCGCDDVSPRRKPNDEPTDELPLRGEATYSERICPKPKQGQFPADDRQDVQAEMAVVLSEAAVSYTTIAQAVTSTPGRALTGPVQQLLVNEQDSNIGPTCLRRRAMVFWLDTVAGC